MGCGWRNLVPFREMPQLLSRLTGKASLRCCKPGPGFDILSVQAWAVGMVFGIANLGWPMSPWRPPTALQGALADWLKRYSANAAQGVTLSSRPWEWDG